MQFTQFNNFLLKPDKKKLNQAAFKIILISDSNYYGITTKMI